LLLLSTLVFAKSYYISNAEVTADIQEDGSVLMSEKITFSFSGSFTYAYRDFELQGQTLSDVEVFEGDKKLNVDYKNKQAKWYYSASNEKRTFNLKYKLTGALNSYTDVNEWYWKMWPGNFPGDTMKFTGIVILPKAVDTKEEIARWAHPALEGSLETIDLQTVRATATSSAENWIEMRVVFPKNVLSSFSGAKQVMNPGLEKIISEEKMWVDTQGFGNLLTGFFAIINFFIIPIFIIYGLYLWFKHGKEPETGYERDYEQEPPYDYSPAVVGALFNMAEQKPAMNDFTATILYLATKKYLRIDKVTKEKKRLFFFKKNVEDYQITLLKDPVELAEYDQTIYNMLKNAAKGNKITFDEFAKKVQKQQMSYHKKFESWRTDAKKRIKPGFYQEDIAIKKLGALVAVPVIMLFLGLIFYFFVGYEDLLFMSIPSFVMVLVAFGMLYVPLRARTKEGALHLARWKAFKKYIEDFSDFKQKPVMDIILWEKYLVYATSLGVADKVIKAMKKLKFTSEEMKNSHVFTSTAMFTSMKFSGNFFYY